MNALSESEQHTVVQGADHYGVAERLHQIGDFDYTFAAMAQFARNFRTGLLSVTAPLSRSRLRICSPLAVPTMSSRGDRR